MDCSNWAFELDRAVKNAVDQADLLTRTSSQVSETDVAVEHARALLQTWTVKTPEASQKSSASPATPRTRGLLDDLEYAGLSAITEIDPSSINSAGDFVSKYLKEEQASDHLSNEAINNTDAFIKRLMTVDLSKNLPKSEPKVNFRAAQRERVNLINAKREQRRKESQIKLAAEKAAREEEKKKYQEEKIRRQKSRLKEDKAITSEISRLRRELEGEKKKTKQQAELQSLRELKKKQAEAEEIKKLQELRREQMEQKMKLEAKNKIIIQQKIENHRRERLNLLSRYINSWSLILVKRRKQSGMAQACRDWHVTRKVFNGWRRWTKKIQSDKIMAEEIQKAKTLRLFESRVTKQKDEILITRLFTAWRLFAKQECERRKLIEAEQEMKLKMDNLLSKLKQRPIPLDDVEDVPEVTEVRPFYPESGDSQIHDRKSARGKNISETDRSEKTVASETKAMIKNFQDEFKLLQAQKMREKRLRKTQEESAKSSVKVSKNTSSKTIESLVKPHKSVLSMEERKQEREKRKNEIIAMKKKKKEEEEAKKHEERRIANENALNERKRKRELLLAEKQAKENQEKLKQLAKETAQKNIAVANQHHVKLLKKRSLNALLIWCKIEKSKNNEKIENFRLEKLRPLIINWGKFVQQKLTQNQRTADHFRYQKLTSNIVAHWKLVKEIEIFQQNRADVFYKAKLPRKSIVLWSQQVMNNKVELWRKEKIAIAHHNKSLQLYHIKLWRKLKKFNEEEKKREDRRAKLRHLVKEVIEDF